MSATTYSPAHHSGRLATAYHTIADRIAKYRTYHRTLNELQALGDRELTDLGLNRSMLRSIAYETAYKL